MNPEKLEINSKYRPKVYKFVTIFTEKIYQPLDLCHHLLYYILVKMCRYARVRGIEETNKLRFSNLKGKNFK